MNTDSLKEQIQFQQGLYDSLSNNLSGLKKAYFHERSKELFVEHPILKSIAWHQYTPYFNDGSECTFRSNHTEPYINGWCEWGDSYDDTADDSDPFAEFDFSEYNTQGKYKPQGLPKEPDDAYRAYLAVMSFLNDFNDEDMLDLFGDHIKVMVTPTEIKTEHCEHD